MYSVHVTIYTVYMHMTGNVDGRFESKDKALSISTTNIQAQQTFKDDCHSHNILILIVKSCFEQ